MRAQVVGGNGLRGHAHLLKHPFAEITVPGVEAVGVDFVPGEEFQLPPPLLPVEQGGEVVHPLPHRVPEAEGGALHPLPRGHGQVTLLLVGIPVKVVSHMEARLEQVENAVIDGPVVGPAEDQVLPHGAENDAVVRFRAFRGKALRPGVPADFPVGGGAADENAAAPGRAGVLLVGYQQVRAADPLDGVPQLLRSVGFQPGGAMAQHNPADRAAVFRNTHKQIPPGTGKTMISFFRR